MAYIISVVGQKGGIGKTTVAWNLFFALLKEKNKVKLIDCDDNQFSSQALADVRGDKDIDIDCMSAKDAFYFIKDCENKYDVVILECGGRIDEELKMAINFADLVIMPLKPAALEINTIKNVENIIDTIPDFNTPCLILPNMVSTHYRNTDLKDMLDLRYKYFKFINTPLAYRSIYSSCLNEGGNIYESGDRKAIWEFDQFLSELVKYG